jgi:hypothetical protein
MGAKVEEAWIYGTCCTPFEWANYNLAAVILKQAGLSCLSVVGGSGGIKENISRNGQPLDLKTRQNKFRPVYKPFWTVFPTSLDLFAILSRLFSNPL